MLFSEEELIPWKAHWKNMPEFDVQDQAPRYQLIVSFGCGQDMLDFAKLLGQRINPPESERNKLQSIWFPPQDIGHYANKRYIAEGQHESEMASIYSNQGAQRFSDDDSGIR